MNNEGDLPLSEEQQIKRARKNFIALAIAYFLGVFNDNFFKQAICLLAVSIGKSSFQGDATILFALPFLLFAAPAGWVSDRFSKRSVVVWGKVLELVAMTAGAYGILYANWPCIFLMLFIMAAQSTIVSPALNGAIPELYPKSYVTKANSIVKLVSTSAILIGIALAGPAIEKKDSIKSEAILFSEVNVSEPFDLLENLKASEDQISKLILSNIDPSFLSLKQEHRKSIGEIIGQQFKGFFNNIISIFSFSKSEKELVDNSQNTLVSELVTKINLTLQSDQFLTLVKEEEFFNHEYNKLKSTNAEDIDDKFKVALVSRKYLENKFPLNLKIIETTSIGKKLIALVIVLTAVLGWLVSLFIPKLKAANPQAVFPIWGPLNTIKVIFAIRKDYLLSWTFFGAGCFYSIANLLVLNINSMGVRQFHFSFLNTSLLVAALLVGICIGSLIAGQISTEKGWYKILPPALLLMGIFSMLIFFAPQVAEKFQYYYLLSMMIFLGVGGGLFIIPSESFCQTRPEPTRKGEVLAAHNFVDFTGVLVSGFAYFVLEAMFPKQSTCMAFLGVIIVILSGVFYMAFLKVAEKEKNREGV